MTKLAIMSDLHIDLNHFGDFEIETIKGLLRQEKIDQLHLAGDIANHFENTARPFIKEIEETLPVTYNLGNHDMLDLKEEEIEALDFQTYQLNKETYLLAFHGWYDYSFSDLSLSKISSLKKTFWFDRRLGRPASDGEICQHSLHRLILELDRLAGKRVIVAMHFVPHQNFIMTHPKFAPFNAFLGSQQFHEIFRRYGVSDVVFGHSHHSFGRQQLDGVTYQARPLGYIREWDLTIDFVNQHPHYNPTGTWNLSKRYNAVRKLQQFDHYKREQFAQEIRNSMTIFDP